MSGFNDPQTEITFHAHHEDEAEFMAKVKKTTILLSVITVIELAIGLGLYFMAKNGIDTTFGVMLLKGIVCILTLAKAYYIVSVFMHLGDEIRNMIMTIVVPLMLFIWFIAAFLIDGNSYKTMRNKYDKHYLETTVVGPVEKADSTGVAPHKDH